MKNCEEIKECIACGNTNLVPLLDLGVQPLANSFLKDPNEPEDKFPLATNRCTDCYHVQLTHKVNPDLLFKNYLYVSGTAKTQLEYFDWFAKFVVERQDRVVSVLDIGCNDGSQLDAFKKISGKQLNTNSWLKILTYGVDPAENLYANTVAKGHNVHCGYFDETFSHQGFDVVICQNAFAHNYDQLAFLTNMGKAVSPDGYIYVTTSQANMIMNSEFDTIYHEHLSFYNIKSMNELCKRAGLHLNDVIRHPIHGTSYIFVISKTKARPAYVDFLIDMEAGFGIYDEYVYDDYKTDCELIISQFREHILLKGEKYKVVGYGAPAKGNTLLNAAGVGLDFIIDDNPLKQGLYTPGVHTPVYGSEYLKQFENEDIVFVPLAWNFYDEIREKIQKLRPNNKDRFLKTHPFVYVE